MKLNNILSSEMPEIDESIKECVNLGQWLLFKSEGMASARVEVAFYLKAGSDIFELNQKGKILKALEKEKMSVRIDELFYFSDIPQPHSLSNMSLSLV